MVSVLGVAERVSSLFVCTVVRPTGAASALVGSAVGCLILFKSTGRKYVLSECTCHEGGF